MTKIICLSDTHCLHREVDVPDGDVLIYAGDMTNIGEFGVLSDFADWLEQLPHKYKIVIAGNHDKCFEKKPIAARALLKNFIYLENTGVEVMGLKIWGSPLTSTIPSWSFVETNEEKRYAFWKQIPEGLDILVTHGPPGGIMDAVPREYIGGGDYITEQCGDNMLLAHVTRSKPKFHVFGHIHEGYGKIESPHTTFLNVSQCDPLYRIKNPPQTFNI